MISEDEKFPFEKENTKSRPKDPLPKGASKGDAAIPVAVGEPVQRVLPAESTSQEGPAQTEQKASVNLALKADTGGILIGSTLEEQYRLARYYCASKLVPKQYDTPEKVLIGMQYARELNFPALIGMRQISIVGNTPSIWGELPKALVLKSGLLEFCEEFWFDKDYNKICFANKNLNAPVYGAICRMRRKGFETSERVFTVDDAKAAGLLTKDTYKNYLKRMLQLRARSWLIKDDFSDCISGIAIAEYDFHVLPEVDPTVVEGENAADKLNKAFLKEGQETQGGNPTTPMPGLQEGTK